MKELILGQIQSFRINQKLVFALDDRWCKIFEDDAPKFQAKIDVKGNYILVGPQVQQPTKRNNQSSKEVSVSV